MEKKIKSDDKFCYGAKVWVDLKGKFVPGVVVGNGKRGKLKIKVRKRTKEMYQNALLERII